MAEFRNTERKTTETNDETAKILQENDSVKEKLKNIAFSNNSLAAEVEELRKKCEKLEADKTFEAKS